MTWQDRAFTRAEAAAVSGLHPTTLDVIIHRNRQIAVLFSEKRKGRRWFSPRDIAVLRIAYECERAGQTWLTALARAFEHLQEPPPPDALLIVPVASVSSKSGVVVTGLPDPLPSSSFIVIPIGRIAAAVQEAVDGLAIH